jgi:uncharacterized protein (DUF2344 family)
MSAAGEPLHDCEVPVCTWRIQMTKTGATKYMSHLDFVRTVERSARRAELPITLSGGFNPAADILCSGFACRSIK